MHIRTRLSLVFSFIASELFILFGAAVYYYSMYHREQDFLKHLKERVEITEKIFLEKESFSAEEFEKIRNQFLHTLPEELEEVLELNGKGPADFEFNYPEALKQRLLQEKEMAFRIGEKQGVSRVFHVKGRDYLIIVTAKDVNGQRYLRDLRKIILSLLLFGVPLIFVSSYFVTRQALMPISKKIKRANTISASNLHQRLEVLNPNDEIGEMAIAFNHLLERLETSFEAQKAFIRNASHEIRNPLTAILGEAEIALNRSRSEEAYRASLKVILSEAEVLNQTVSNLLQLSRIQSTEDQVSLEDLKTGELIDSITESCAFQHPDQEINLQSEAAAREALIRGNRSLLQSAIGNILDNACKFSDGQAVDLLLSLKEEALEIRIRDKGAGIRKEDLEKVFTPFFRGANSFGIAGSGIGLSLSKKIIELHGGHLTLHSEPGRGSEAVLTLPLIQH